MYGAILGDIIGSPFEFDRGDKTKEFDLFTKGCDFTDDSVMTIAVGEALLAVGPEATVKEIEEAVVTNMQDWGKRYPYAGYGGRFRYWLRERNPKPYGSYGNGSAMRVSAAGGLYDSLERTREVARATANVTHNHPEGIKGAEATASAIYMARNESSKEEIKEYIEREFHYNLDRALDEIRPGYHMDETCQRTVPEAIIAFLESKDFEDAIRNAVSLGGDTDTLGAITGSIAEAFYGIPAVLIAECRSRIDEGLMTDIFDEFDHILGRDKNADSDEKNGTQANTDTCFRDYFFPEAGVFWKCESYIFRNSVGVHRFNCLNIRKKADRLEKPDCTATSVTASSGSSKRDFAYSILFWFRNL